MMMFDLDERGWHPVHYAAQEGSKRQMERLLSEEPELLECPTANKGPRQGYTPLLCAVYGNKTEMFTTLQKNKANLKAMSTDGKRAIDIAIQEKHQAIFIHLYDNFKEEYDPIKTLLEKINDSSQEISTNAIRFIDELLQKGDICSKLWKDFYDSGILKISMKLLQSDAEPTSKKMTFHWILSLCDLEDFRNTVINSSNILEFLLSIISTIVSDYEIGPNSPNSNMNTIIRNKFFFYIFRILNVLAHKSEQGLKKLRDKGGVPICLNALLELVNSDETKLDLIQILDSLVEPTNFVDKPERARAKLRRRKPGREENKNEVNLMMSSEMDHDVTVSQEEEEDAEDEEDRENGEEEMKGEGEEISDEEAVHLKFDKEEKEGLNKEYIAELSQKQEELQEEFRSFQKLVNLTGLYEPRPTEKILLKLNPLVAKICKSHEENQKLFVEKGSIVPKLLIITKEWRVRDIQLSCIGLVKTLTQNNKDCQDVAVSAGSIEVINTVLKRSRQNIVQLSCSSALWALVGTDIIRKRHVTDLIGVRLFLDYLTTDEKELLTISTEALAVLCEGPFGKGEEIGNLGGIIPLLRLLRYHEESIVVNAIRALRRIVVGIGLVPVTKNQQLIIDSRGHKFLLALMKHGKTDRVQIEAALTLAYISIGNDAFFDEFDEENDFSYAPLLLHLHSANLVHRCKVGTALACFAFNDRHQQVQISRYRALRYRLFQEMLATSEGALIQCNAAFQAIVLSKIMEDEEAAICAANGIKVIVGILEGAQADDVVLETFVCECICRLSRFSDGGVPEAMIAIDVIQHLTSLIERSEDVHVKGTASIALGYLSMRHSGQRNLLNICRRNGSVVKTMQTYCNPPYKISTKFMERWKHAQQVGK